MPRGLIHEVADGVLRVAGARTNFAVVTDGGDVCLVDTGWPNDWELVVEALARISRTPVDVAALLITHGHIDHVGSAERLRGTGATVRTHVDEAPNVRGERQESVSRAQLLVRLWRPRTWSFLANGIRAGGAEREDVAEVEVFDEGEPLDAPGGPVPILTPGHTSGHCAFHLPDRGVVFSGDALVTRDSLTHEEGPRVLNRLFNHDHDQTLRSLDRFRDLEAEVVVPGHGDPYEGTPADMVERALRAEGR